MDKERENYEIEKNLEKQQATLNKFEAKINDLDRKIEQGEKEVKTLIQSGNKDKAKRVLKNVKRHKEEIVNLQGKLNLIEKQKMQIESQKDDVGFFDAIKDGNKIIGANQEKQEELMEELEKAKELENEQKMNQDMMNQMLEQSSDEDLDDELAGYEQQLNSEEALNMDKQFNQAQGNIVDPNLNQAQQQKAPQKKDDVDDMFANLMAS